VIAYKIPLLQKAARHFSAQSTAERRGEYERFCAANAAWLGDFALFMAVKERFQQVSWYEWDADIALRRPQAIAHWAQALAQEVATHRVLQFFFFEQWQQVKAYANVRGIQIVGDVPIFVAPDSADVWANRDLFHLDEGGHPTLISGVPPDYLPHAIHTARSGHRAHRPLSGLYGVLGDPG